MPRVIKKHVKDKLEQWTKVQKQIAKAEKKANTRINPIIERHNEEMKPFLEEREHKVAPLKATAAELEKEITAMITVDRDTDGNPKPIMIDSVNAIATVEKKEGTRVVDVQKYFEAVKTKGVDFWKSLKVTIKAAEPIVGKNKIDYLSDKKVTYPTTIKLK